MPKRTLIVAAFTMVLMMVGGPAFACGGLIGPRGNVNLLRTSTFAGYHDGVEHYVTSFTFTGQGGGKFGSLVPLPDVPSKVERGGDWTLQRLQREVAPPVQELALADGFATRSAASAPRVLLKTKIDALDITVLEGGARAIGQWAADNGYELPPDSPEVLEFYARRSPIFMAASFDAEAAKERGQLAGDGTPIHLTIPTKNPWVPLRILGLGKNAQESVEADVFLLTEREPATLPVPVGAGTTSIQSPGLSLERSEIASNSLMNDLRTDKGGSWIPGRPMWFSYIRVNERAGALGYDLAIDATGNNAPSPVDAGFPAGIVNSARDAGISAELILTWIMVAALLSVLAGWVRRRGASVA